jgi:hypothetical protein
MTETTTVIIPSVPLTTVNNLFSITHRLIDQYRQSISIFAGTGIFLFFNILIIHQYFSSYGSMVV